MNQKTAPITVLWYLRAVFSVVFCALGLGAQAEETAQIFAAHKDKVLQIRILDRASGSKSSIGSGFLVSAQGHIISNFHVIAEWVHKPEQYRIEYVSNNGSRGELKLLNIDVIHDLALLKSDAPAQDYFAIQVDDPVQGERLFSLGNPHDLGLTIVEGTYNGLLEKSFYKKIHFTGSINPGMSGGPSINRTGNVVGINVSTAGNQLSFLVPGEFAAQLLQQGKAEEDIPDFSALVRDQLLANQEHYMDQLLAEPFTQVQMNGFSVPGRLSAFLNCWGDTRKRQDELIEQVYHTCSTTDTIFLSHHQSSGIIRYRHVLYTSKELGATRFYGFLEQQFQNANLSPNADEEMVTNYVCETGLVEHQGLHSKTVFCLRAYKKFPGLYDAVLTAITLTRRDEALQTILALAGVSYANATRFPRRYLETISWTP